MPPRQIKYYKITGKSAKKLLEAIQARAAVIAKAIKFSKRVGADPKTVRSGTLSGIDFSLTAVEFPDAASVDKKIWASASREESGLYRPRRSKKNKALLEEWRSYKSYDLSTACQSLGIEDQIWHGFAISYPGIRVVGTTVYILTKQDKLQETADIKRISDIEYEKATTSKKKPKKKAVKS